LSGAFRFCLSRSVLLRLCAALLPAAPARCAGAMAAELRQGRAGSILDEELDALLAAQENFLASSGSDDTDSGSDGGSDSDSDSADGAGGRLPWALRNVPVLVSWTSLAAVFALQPPGRRIPPTLDLIVTTVRAPHAPCALAHVWTHAAAAPSEHSTP